MEKTILKLIVSEPEQTILVPDTGYSTSLGADAISKLQNPLVITLSLISITLAILAVAMFLRHRKLAKTSFNLAHNKNTVIARSLLAIFAIGTAGYLGGNIISELNIANAATNGVEASTLGTLTVNAELKKDEPVTVCGTDTVTIGQDLPAGYSLNMHAEDLILADTTNVKIATTDAEGKLAEGTWGYTLATTPAETSILPVPAEAEVIKSVDTATEEGEATKVSYCFKLGSDTLPGTYTTEVNYQIVPEYITYTLRYDANGGTFAEQPEAQTSGEVIDTSYDFVIADIVPSTTTNKQFYGWSLTGDSLSTIYQAGDTITVTEPNTTLKAVWGYGRYIINYNKNTNATVNNFTPRQFCILMEENATTCNVTIMNSVPTVEGYSLLGWSKVAYTPSDTDNIDTARGKVDYKPGDTLTMDADLDLFAVWWAVSTSDFQMELRWGEAPRDLDSYLVGVRNSDKRQMFTVYFSHKTEQIENGTITLNAKLDIDDLSSYGPETITLDMLPQSAYTEYTFYYYIRNYSGENSHKIKESGANITLIKKGELLAEYDVAEATGASATYWNVFAIKNGQIVVRNTLTSNPDITY